MDSLIESYNNRPWKDRKIPSALGYLGDPLCRGTQEFMDWLPAGATGVGIYALSLPGFMFVGTGIDVLQEAWKFGSYFVEAQKKKLGDLDREYFKAHPLEEDERETPRRLTPAGFLELKMSGGNADPIVARD